MHLETLINGKKFSVKLTPIAHADLCGTGIRTCEKDCTKDGIIGEIFKANKKSAKDVTSLMTRIKKYADIGRLVIPEQFNMEGDGFFAFKVFQIRAYAWRDGKNIIISHFIKKKSQKLSDVDFEKMKNNRRLYIESKE